MPNRVVAARVLGAIVVLSAVIVSSSAAGAADPEFRGDAPSPVGLVAPFECGTEWQGTTYPGHGAHDWNLDLNRVGGPRSADLGQPILAQGDGVVVWFKETGYNNRAGTYVEVDYGDLTVRYIHLVDGSIPADVAEIGARVRTGELLGLLGATGRATGPHLHLEYWDSADHDDAAWWQLPRENQVPVVFDGQEMVATPATPSAVASSTNCAEPTRDERRNKPWLSRYLGADDAAAG